MERALDELAVVLERDPRSSLRSLDVLPPLERALLVESWNQTRVRYPGERAIPELFAEQVRRAPAATCVVEGGLVVSWGELGRGAPPGAGRLAGGGGRARGRG